MSRPENCALRRLLTSAAVAGISGLLLLPSSIQATLARDYGFFLILGVYAFALFLVFRPHSQEHPDVSGNLLASPSSPLPQSPSGMMADSVLAALLILGMLLISPPQFRVLSDETNLLGISYSMVTECSIKNPLQGIFPPGQPDEILMSAWDIRPIGFPFSVAILHLLFGYNPHHPFVINAIAGFLLLLAFQRLLRRIVSPGIAASGTILLAGVPVLVLVITSGGMEATNIAYFLASLLTLARFRENPRGTAWRPLLGFLLLFAYSRYEAVLFSMLLLPFIAWSIPPANRTGAIFCLSLIPWFYLPLTWHRLGILDPERYQVLPGDTMFGLDHFWKNLLLAGDYFQSFHAHFGTSAPLFYLFLAGSAVLIASRSTACRQSPLFRPLALAGGAYLTAYSLVLLPYHTGDLTNFWTIRLGAIFFPGFLWVGMTLPETLTRRFPWGKPIIPVLALILAIIHLGVFWPVAAANQAIRASAAFKKLSIMQSRRLSATYRPEDLLITDQSNLFVPFRWSAVHFQFFREDPERFRRALGQGKFRRILALQHLDETTQTLIPLTDLSTTNVELKHIEKIPWIPGLSLLLQEVSFPGGPPTHFPKPNR